MTAITKQSRTRSWRARTDAILPTAQPLGYVAMTGEALPWSEYRTRYGRALYLSQCRRLAIVQSPVGKAWYATIGKERLPGYSRTLDEAVRKARAALTDREREARQQAKARRATARDTDAPANSLPTPSGPQKRSQKGTLC